MKPAPFAYDRAESVEETLALLAEHGDDAKVLAGGQSLVPLLNFRLARPERLIDINEVDELDRLEVNGAVRIGALTRQSTLEHSDEIAAKVPLLQEAMRFVAHPQIRNRGTVGGSVAHADPSAELPAVLSALDAVYHLRSRAGTRTVSSDEMFVTHLTTALRPDELLTEIEVPVPAPGTGSAFLEFARRHGDFALAGAVVLVAQRGDGTCERASIALLAAGPVPVRAVEAEEALAGQRVDDGVAREAAATAVRDVRPLGDIHGGAAYRRKALEALVRRALLLANDRAQGGRS
ncbi:MAG TPA: xanthine dehydrogenase family protein subunit M [Gaiellaceae bacterium]|nr:xanthine dehydrogenase family protein subunit M [Gaiellaceae bacterium]